MRAHPVRAASIALILVLVSSCSQGGERAGKPQEGETTDAGSPPNIALSAAPGVAFKYDYQFNLADRRISATQEAHASACERLGLARCRITGMSYNVDENEQVVAGLEVKLAPQIARQFGKAAQQLVERNDGKLVRLHIGSSDEGSAINQATRQQSDESARLAQLREELAKTRAGSEARANLLSQIEALEQQMQRHSMTIAAGQEALATTPMAFHYYGHGGVPGFRGDPLREAWHTFVTTVVWLIGMLLQAVAVLLPLGFLIAALVALWRTRPVKAARRWFAGRKKVET